MAHGGSNARLFTPAIVLALEVAVLRKFGVASAAQGLVINRRNGYANATYPAGELSPGADMGQDTKISQVIQCPAGWMPVGPFCTVLASVFPFTECPYQKKRYRTPYVIQSPFLSPTPGICISQEGTGVILRCPKGLHLEVNPITIGREYLRPIKRSVRTPRKSAGAGDPRGGDPKGGDPEGGDPEGGDDLDSVDDLDFVGSPNFIGEGNLDLRPPLISPNDRSSPVPAARRLGEKRGRVEDVDWVPSLPRQDGRIAGLVEEEYEQEGYAPRFPWNRRFGSDDFMGEDDVGNPLQMTSEYRCVGTEQHFFSPTTWAQRGQLCPLGSSLVQTVPADPSIFTADATTGSISDGVNIIGEPSESGKICESHPVLPAEPFCPEKYRPALVSYNGANFLSAQAIKCIRETRFKGRLWCPDGFVITRNPYPGMPFGSEMLSENAGRLYDPAVYDRLGFQQAGLASCVRAIAVPASQCDQFKCHDPMLAYLSVKIKHFAFFRLQRDPFYIKQDSIPNGKDYRWGPNGRFFPY